MSLLSDADLTSMRATAAEALPETCVIHAGTVTVDSVGDRTEAFLPVAGGTVACRVAPLSGSERELGSRISSDANAILTLPFDAPLTSNSQVRVSGGGTFNVEHIRDRSLELTTRAEAVKVV